MQYMEVLLVCGANARKIQGKLDFYASIFLTAEGNFLGKLCLNCGTSCLHSYGSSYKLSRYRPYARILLLL